MGAGWGRRWWRGSDECARILYIFFFLISHIQMSSHSNATENGSGALKTMSNRNTFFLLHCVIATHIPFALFCSLVVFISFNRSFINHICSLHSSLPFMVCFVVAPSVYTHYFCISFCDFEFLPMFTINFYWFLWNKFVYESCVSMLIPSAKANN